VARRANALRQAGPVQSEGQLADRLEAGVSRAAAPPLVVARGLEKRFGPHRAVAGIDFEIGRGEAFGFLGANGAGKSSTMRMIACLSPASGGDLRVLGRDPARDGPEIRRRLGLVPQDDSLDLELTVADNLLIYGRYFGLRRRELRERIADLLEFAELTTRADEKVERLSGGMRRRLTIARALVNRPEMLLLDEPTTGLDPQARHLLWDRLWQLKAEGVSLVLTTHYMDEAEQLCDRLVVMDAGRIVAAGTPATLIADYASPEVLEVRFEPGTAPLHRHQVLAAVGSVADRVEALADRLLVYTADGEAARIALGASGVHPASVLVRRASLEDVFLRLTGRHLIE